MATSVVQARAHVFASRLFLKVKLEQIHKNHYICKMSNNRFRFKKPYIRVSVGNGAMIADFFTDKKRAEGNYLHIYTPNGVFSQKVTGYPFGYLLTAVKQGNEKEVEAYCIMLWRITQEIYQDLGFCQDIIKAINKRDKRLMKEAKRKSESVTDAEEMANQAFMEDVVAEQSMSKKELKAKREADRAMMREMLNEERES